MARRLGGRAATRIGTSFGWAAPPPRSSRCQRFNPHPPPQNKKNGAAGFSLGRAV